MASRLTTFLKELKRRKVYHVAVVYVAATAGILGIAEPALGDAGWENIRIPVVALLIIGFPVALILAWAYEVRAEVPTPAKPGGEEPGVSAEPSDSETASTPRIEITTTAPACAEIWARMVSNWNARENRSRWRKKSRPLQSPRTALAPRCTAQVRCARQSKASARPRSRSGAASSRASANRGR